MWISWSTKSPIMDSLIKLPHGVEICGSDSFESKAFMQYSVSTNTLYDASYRDPYAVFIKTIEEFQKTVFLMKLGMTNKEIQQPIDLGITDGT